MNQSMYHRNELILRFGSEARLGDVFLEIEKEMRVLDQVVCQFKVNGLALDEEGERRLSQASLADVDFLEILSQTPAALLENILQNWQQKIPLMIQTNDELAEVLRSKGVEGRLKIFVDLVTDCQLLVDSLLSIETVFPTLDILKTNEWGQAQAQMHTAIGEALQAFQAKDYPQLADILEYDLGHALQVWLDLFVKLAQSLKATHTQTNEPGDSST